MTRLNIDIPDDLRLKLEARASAAGQANLEQYIQMLLQADAESGTDFGAPEHLTVADDRALEAALLERLDDGPNVEATPELWQELRGRIRGAPEQR